MGYTHGIGVHLRRPSMCLSTYITDVEFFRFVHIFGIRDVPADAHVTRFVHVTVVRPVPRRPDENHTWNQPRHHSTLKSIREISPSLQHPAKQHVKSTLMWQLNYGIKTCTQTHQNEHIDSCMSSYSWCMSSDSQTDRQTERLTRMKTSFSCMSTHSWCTLADLRGAPGMRPPGPNSFIFMQFSGNVCPNNRLAPQPGGWRPLLWEILDPPLMHVLRQTHRHVYSQGWRRRFPAWAPSAGAYSLGGRRTESWACTPGGIHPRARLCEPVARMWWGTKLWRPNCLSCWASSD